MPLLRTSVPWNASGFRVMKYFKVLLNYQNMLGLLTLNRCPLMTFLSVCGKAAKCLINQAYHTRGYQNTLMHTQVLNPLNV